MALGDFRNISRAAQDLHTSQPSVSRTMTEIEALCGVTLFQRTHSGTVPTPQGEILVECARKMLREVDLACDEIESLEADPGGGLIRIGSMSLAEVTLLPAAISRLKVLMPQVAVRVSINTLESLVHRLRLGELDVVLGRLSTVDGDPTLHLQPLYEESFVIVAGTQNPLALCKAIDWEKLLAQPWLLSAPGTGARSRFDAFLLAMKYEAPTCLAEVDSYLLTLGLLRETVSVAILPKGIADTFCESGMLAELPASFSSGDETVGVITSKHAKVSRAASSLLTVLKTAAKSCASQADRCD